MPDNELDELGTTWSERFLPSRLFGTFGMALLPTTRLLLCLACVLICYGAGRLMDRVWLGAGAGVTVSADGERIQTEIEAHATMPSRDFAAWHRAVTDANRRFEIESVYRWGDGVESKQAAEELLKSADARSLIEKKYADAPAAILKLVAERRDAGLKVIDADQEATTAEKQQRREKVLRAADYYRFVASGCDTERYFTPRDVAQAAQDLVSADTGLDTGKRNDTISQLRSFVLPPKRLLELDRRQPQGPFGALLT
ncbi:MAG: hypothetical protein IID33_14010, partial [Planctomycetes bacterium]|nr:hypothetical protein [Planctomycetota bacterium]